MSIQINRKWMIECQHSFDGKALFTVWLLMIVLGGSGCSDDNDAETVNVQTISEQLAAVRDYVPLYAVIAHRGSTYWTPEETESAWRWARETGADYLESENRLQESRELIRNDYLCRKVK